MHLKVQEKQGQTDTSPNRRKKLINIKAEINEIETKRVIYRVSETKSWFFEKMNKIDKPLAKVDRREKSQISSI